MFKNNIHRPKPNCKRSNCDNTGSIFPEEVVIYEQGKEGKNAYEIAVDNGFIGTVEEWLESLTGESAYQIWLDLGNEGTEQDFIDYLSANLKANITQLEDVDIPTLIGEDGKYLTIEDGKVVAKTLPEADATLTETWTVTNPSTGKQGLLLEEGMYFTEALKLLTTTTQDPTITNPDFSVTLTPNSLQEVAAIIPSLGIIVNVNRGSILGANVGGVWNPSALQAQRSGAPSSYTISGVVTTSPSRYISNYVVTQGLNSFTANVTLSEGVQPKDSSGGDFGSPYPATTLSNKTASFEGVYPLFATTSSINTLTKQPLVSMLTANNVQIDLVAETGGSKQVFEIPNAWLSSRDLVSVQYFNTLSGQWDTTNRKSEFAQTSTTKVIQGNSVNYTRFTYTGIDRGQVRIRLLF